MCKCTPEIRTPFCGRPGCDWPEQQPIRGEKFGALLKEKRKSCNASQRALAEWVGVDFTYLSKIENDHEIPSAELTLRLAEALGADPMEFWEAADNVPKDVYKAQIDALRERVEGLEASLKAAGLPLYGPPVRQA